MEKTNELLDQVKRKYGLTSDYQLAGKLGLTRSVVSAYRTGKNSLGEEAALRVAALLDLNAGYVLASMQAERTSLPAARDAWERLADDVKRLGATAAALAVAPIVALLVDSGPMLSAGRWPEIENARREQLRALLG